MEEYFDIVDENNVSTGQKSLRSEAHAQGLWHRTVQIYFFREMADDIEFLVQLRAKTKDCNPNKWMARFGGHLKTGENIEEAIKGELRDEIGLDIKQSNLIQGKIYKSDEFPNREFANVFYYKFEGKISDLKFNDGEVQKVKWMKSADILELMIKEPNMWAGREKGFFEIIAVLKSKLSIYEKW